MTKIIFLIFRQILGRKYDKTYSDPLFANVQTKHFDPDERYRSFRGNINWKTQRILDKD